jgi:hypothetical protein
MTLEEYRRKSPDRPLPVPAEYAGRWIAWNREHTQIIADGATLSEVCDKAKAAGCDEPILQPVPRGPLGFT